MIGIIHFHWPLHPTLSQDWELRTKESVQRDGNWLLDSRNKAPAGSTRNGVSSFSPFNYLPDFDVVTDILLDTTMHHLGVIIQSHVMKHLL